MKQKIKRWCVSLKWEKRKSINRKDRIEDFKKAVETLEQNFNVKIGSDIFQHIYVLDNKTGNCYDWRDGDTYSQRR